MSSTSPSAGSVLPPVTAYGRTTGPESRRTHRPGGTVPHSPAEVVLAGNLACETRCGLARLTSIAIS